MREEKRSTGPHGVDTFLEILNIHVVSMEAFYLAFLEGISNVCAFELKLKPHLLKLLLLLHHCAE